MHPKARRSPSLKPLIVYPHLHRNSQCHSCSTVIPGDICFNCGRLSTLLVTPRPPRTSLESRKQTTTTPTAIAHGQPVHSSKLLHTQQNLTASQLAAKDDLAQKCARERAILAAKQKLALLRERERAFGSQFAEVEKLLDTRGKRARVHTLASSEETVDSYIS